MSGALLPTGRSEEAAREHWQSSASQDCDPHIGSPADISQPAAASCAMSVPDPGLDTHCDSTSRHAVGGIYKGTQQFSVFFSFEVLLTVQVKDALCGGELNVSFTKAFVCAVPFAM